MFLEMFSERDLEQIIAHGLSVEQVESQIENFRRGFPYLDIARAATIGDGIAVLSQEEIDAALSMDNFPDLDIVKFVPASGAATRMFKELYDFINGGSRNKGVDTLLESVERLAFWEELKATLPDDATDRDIISAILTAYGSKPKALIPFHSYKGYKESKGDCCKGCVREAIDEHFVEAAQCGVSKMHFTVSPEHLADFKAHVDRREGSFEVSFSVQKPSTDTIAVGVDNEPFRVDSGELLFRPAGHGALIENIADIDADIISIKTIDNVTTDALRSDTIKYKRALICKLLKLQKEAFGYIRAIDAKEITDSETGSGKIREFIEDELMFRFSQDKDKDARSKKTEISVEQMRAILDRPIRVCGMVRNEGEPGGGPFWVANSDGTQSLQIAESSQISPAQRGLMSSATHFNPVDLVCGVKSYKGERFNLAEYVDPATGFISEKSSGGRTLKAQELPGLWNGAMAKWNTIFVEVPISTFTPVKVIQDLLRVQHQ